MIRVHLLTPCLAVGVCLAILVPIRGGSSARPWNPDEQNTALFDQEGGSLSRTLAAAPVSPTLAKWKDAVRPKARVRSLVLGKEPKGVRLASFETQLSVLEGCAMPEYDEPVVISVTMGGNDDTCSTASGKQSNTCSVIGSTNVGACSVDSNSQSNYCSSGAGGAGAAPYPTNCSVPNSKGTSACSAQDLKLPTSETCSTQGLPANVNNGAGTVAVHRYSSGLIAVGGLA